MVWKILAVLFLLVLVIWAVRTRVTLKRKYRVNSVENAVASPASVALGELVAIAGGVYCSLILVVSFLKLSVPEKITLLNMPLDPLAMLAIVIALLQPIFLTIYYSLFQK